MKRLSTFTEPCGCVYRVEHDREWWEHLCPKHRAESLLQGAFAERLVGSARIHLPRWIGSSRRAG